MHLRSIRLIAGITTSLAAVLLTHSSAGAVILYGPTDTKYIAPTGEYASIPWGKVAIAVNDGSGRNPVWPISPNWALRANHVTGGKTGYDVEQNGVLYNVVESINVANSDLRLVRVSQPFSSFFHMYSGNDEIGKELVMFGNSAPGKEAEVHAAGTNRFNGWFPGNPALPQPGESADLNWGRNRVRDNVNVFGTDTLYATFDAPSSSNSDSVGDDEGIVYNGDSGGAFFIQQSGEWRIAGITYAVDAGYLTKNGSLFLGAIFDSRDLWGDFYIDPNNPAAGTERRLITGDEPVPFGSYASRVSTYRANIDTITGQTAGLGPVVVPEYGAGILTLLGAAAGFAPLAIARRRSGC